MVACHITGPSTGGNDMKNLIVSVIKASKSIGLNVANVTSDMRNNNKALWVSLGVSVTKRERIFNFDCCDSKINVQADAPYLLKNWKNALQNSAIYLPPEIVKEEHLPSNIVVNATYINTVWNMKTNNGKAIRSLHHLTEDIMTPGHFSKMHVGYAMRYISLATAEALEMAVIKKNLPPEALTLAWFIRLLRQWFDLVNSRTRNNFKKKEEFLNYFVKVIEGTVIGKGCKPLNTGSILTSLSFVDTAKRCINKEYKFLLGSRLSQDGLENVFSQIRKKYGKKPSALQCLRAVKLICVSQFMSDIKNTSYSTDSDQ